MVSPVIAMRQGVQDAEKLGQVMTGAADIQITMRNGLKVWTIATLNTKINLVQVRTDQIIRDLNVLSANKENQINSVAKTATDQINNTKDQANLTISRALQDVIDAANQVQQRGDQAIAELNDAINIAAAAGAGANGWSDKLVAMTGGGTLDTFVEKQKETNNKTLRFYKTLKNAIDSKNEIKNNEIIFISEIHADTSKGGGRFRYEQGRLKNQHDGGTIIDLDKPFPLDWTDKTQISEWFFASDAGNGCLVRLKEGELFTASNFGAVQNQDSTLQIQKAIDCAKAKSNQECAWLEEGDSFKITGLDLSSSYKKLRSNCINIEGSLPTLTTTGAPTVFTTTGKSVAIFLGDALIEPNVKRGQVLFGINLVEGSSTALEAGQRYYGIFGKGVPHHNIANIRTEGFEVGGLITYCWLTNTDNLSFQKFRQCGFSTIDYDAVGSSASNNGWNIGRIHASSSIAAPYNFDFSSGNSIFVASLTSEGSKVSHLKISSKLRSLTIGSLHCEGAASFITVDVDLGSPTLPFSSVNILGGDYANAGGGGKQFVKRLGTAINTGLAYLKLGALNIQKSSVAEETFFDLSSVAVFDSQAVFESHSDPIKNTLTWYNVGGSINRTFKRAQYGHNGLLAASLNKGIYTGQLKTELHTKSVAGSALTAPQNIVAVKAGIAQRFRVEVVCEYTAGAFAGRYFYAEFLLFKTVNETLIQKLINENDSYAKDTVFALDVSNGVITATNTANLGTFYFDIVKKENVAG